MTDKDPAQRQPIDLIIIEDSSVDVELVTDSLVDAGLKVTVRVVENEPDFRAALGERLPDAILSDWTMPNFSGRIALAIAQEICPDVPLIFVSGTLSEAYAFEAMSHGTRDYVFKHQLHYLGPALTRALNEAGNQRALRESEGKYRNLFESSREALMVMMPPAWHFTDGNQAMLKMFGAASRDDFVALALWEVSPERQPDGRPSMEKAQEMMAIAIREGSHFFEWEHRRLNGKTFIANVLLTRMEEKEQVFLLGTVRDISVRKKEEEQRLTLVAELEKRNAELERFTYTVSHDLKTPLVTISSFIGQLEQDLENDERDHIKTDLAFIQSAADKMHKLLASLLDLSRAGRPIGEAQPVELPALVRQVTEHFSGGLNPARLRVVMPTGLPVVKGDPVRLREVLQNLLENAVKFTTGSPEPLIEVGGTAGDGEVVCWVRDNGIGIPAAYQHKIFGLFEKLNPSTEGTGIGLAIVRRIIEEHGGRVWVESNGEGQGSEFFFTLPAGSPVVTNPE